MICHIRKANSGLGRDGTVGKMLGEHGEDLSSNP